MHCYKLDNELSQLEPHEQTLSIAMLIDSAALDTTHDWLLTQRKEHSHNSSIWHLRFHWETIKPALQKHSFCCPQ